jgi:ABC-type transport system involved in multi-copper enzyme maturation permease subunit
VSAALSIARVSILRATRRPSSWWLSALAFAPAVLGAALGAAGYGALAVPAPLLVSVAAPLLVIPWVAGVLGEAFERRTVIYWFVRPMARPTALLGEWIGAAVSVGAVLLLGAAMLAVANALTGNAAISSLVRLPLAVFAEAVSLAGFSVGVGALSPKHPVSVAVGAMPSWRRVIITPKTISVMTPPT